MEASTAGEREFSVVVFGVSGIAGRNVAAYLAERAGEVGARWAVAGRDPAKIERVLGEIAVSPPETIVADAGDPTSLAAMASRTRVVLDLVGPYTLYGPPVVEACVAAGTHYVDLTGEMPFVRRTIDAFHGRATAAGVKVVQVSGFEALPPDLTVLLAAETARERWGEELAEVDLEVATQQPQGRIGLSDLISGGTLQSTVEAIGGEDAAAIADPAVLIVDPTLAETVRSRSPIPLAPRFNARGDAIAPMTPAPFINPAIIHRTTALLAAERGFEAEPFRYREGVTLPGGGASLPLRYAAAAALGATQAGFRSLSRARPSVRRRAAAALRRLLPKSGFGPTGERLEDWTWQVAVEARTAGGHHVRVDLDADAHPGYLTTSRMLGEVGLLLAEDGATPAIFGCLTPAAALGTGSLKRFERAGLRFAVSS
jgi:short subunit dehydrogenase-like uncharacterized protein